MEAKMTSFSDKNQVFLYSADKTGDSGFDDLLISPSPTAKLRKKQQAVVNKQEEVYMEDEQNWKSVCKEYEEFLAEIESEVPKARSEPPSQRVEEVILAPNVQITQAKPTPSQQVAELGHKTVTFAIQPEQVSPQPVIAPIKKQSERITLGPNEWMKQLTQQAETSDTNLDNQKLKGLKEQTKKETPKTEGKKEENFRFTVAYSELMALMQSNNEAFIQLSNSKRESENWRRSSVGRQSGGFDEESQAKQYFEQLVFRSEERKVRVERLKVLTAQLEQEAAESRRKLQQMQARKVEQQRRIKEKQKELSKLRSISLELQDYNEVTSPLMYFQATYNIEIFELSRDGDEFNCSFRIDEDIFGRIKREKGKNELRLSPSPLLEFQPRPEWLIDTNGRLELFRLYFNLHLQREELATEVLKRLAAYYNSLQSFQDSLRQIMFLFTVQDLQLSVNSQKLTFRVLLKPEVTIQITVHLLRTDEPDFSEFYHYESRQGLALPSPSDGKFLRYFQMLIRHFAE